jgi:hypothetical protein
MRDQLWLCVLGRPELSLGGHPLDRLASAKATALLVHLALTGVRHSRWAIVRAVAGLRVAEQPGGRS